MVDPGRAQQGIFRIVAPSHGGILAGVAGQLDYDEIIAIAEDPNVREGESMGRAASRESLEEIAETADALFLRCSVEQKIKDIVHFPPEISARRLARMTDHQRAEILSHLPTPLVQEIVALLPVSSV